MLVVNRDGWYVESITPGPRITPTHHGYATVTDLAATTWTLEEAFMDAVFSYVLHQGQ